MVLRGQPAESRLNRALIGERRHAQDLVIVPRDLHLVEGLVERVQKVARDNKDKDAPAVTVVSRCSRLGARFTRTNSYAIVDALEERCRILFLR